MNLASNKSLKKVVLFLCHFENDTSCRNELLHCILALLEWLIRLVHYGNSNHFNALAELFHLRYIHRNAPGCFHFATDSKTQIHDFANREKR